MTYEESELKGRTLIKELIPILYDQNKYHIHWYTTDPHSTYGYDGFVQVWSKDDNNLQDKLIASHLLEVKIRNKHYQDLLIEKPKFNDLIRASKRCDATPFYITSTPKGTYIYNLTKINSIQWQRETLTISSVEKEKGDKMKTVGYLSVNDATKVVHITYNDIEDKHNAKRLETLAVVKEHQRNKCLFNYLLCGQ